MQQAVAMDASDVADLDTMQQTAGPLQQKKLSAFAVDRRVTLHTNANFREMAEGVSRLVGQGVPLSQLNARASENIPALVDCTSTTKAAYA